MRGWATFQTGAKPQWEVCRRVMVSRRRDSQAGARQVNESEEWLDEVTGRWRCSEWLAPYRGLVSCVYSSVPSVVGVWPAACRI
jgi:hypothetical protein